MPCIFKYIFTALFCSLFISNAKAQIDTEFWFAAPDFNNLVVLGVTLDRPVYFNITTYTSAATVTISTPAGTMPTQTLNISANSTNQLDITTYINLIECTPGNVIQNKGIRITSTAPISVYYESRSLYSPELFTLKGRNALGKDFIISSQNVGINNFNTATPPPSNSFNIVASEDNTVVTINPKQPIVGHVANIPFNVTLNRGQTYAAVATLTTAAGHLMGSRVSSTKPIAITLGDDNVNMATYGTCSDVCGDQTVPISLLGTEYIAVAGSLNAPYDNIFVTATADNTQLYDQAGSLIATINATETHRIPGVLNTSIYFRASKPVYALLFTGYGCEFGTAVLPKLECTGSSSVSFVRTSSEACQITLVVKAGAENNFTVNGNPLFGGSFNNAGPAGNLYKTAKATLNIGTYPVGAVINVKNTAALFQIGVIQGGPGSGCSVGYFSDFGNAIAPITNNGTTFCNGATLNLATNLVTGAIYNWTGPNGYTNATNNVVINNVAVANTGWYYLNANVSGCIAKDSVYITVNDKKYTTINKAICNGGSYEGYTMAGTYINTFSTPSGCDSVRTLILTVGQHTTSTIVQSICQGQSFAGYTTSGTYVDVLVNSNGCDSTRTIILTVKPKSFTTVNKSICAGQSFLGYTASGTFVNTFTAANGCDSVRTLILNVVSVINTTVNKTICMGQSFEGYNTSGTYSNTFVSSGGCDSVRTLNLIVKTTQFVTINKAICQGDSYEGFTTSGMYVTNLTTAEGCDSIRTINLTVKPKTFSNINKLICDGTSFEGYTTAGTYVNTFTGSNGCDSVRTLILSLKPKAFKTISPVICEGRNFLGFTTSGIYTQTLIAANGCDSVLTINLTVTPRQRANITQTICAGSSYLGYATAGTYVDTLVAASGCDSIRTVQLTVNTPPIFTLGNTTTLCTNDSLILSPGIFSSYLWQDGSTQNKFVVKTGGLYKVTATNLCGSTTQQISVIEQACKIYFPNAFTPNADGKNDVFRAINAFGLQNFKLQIYNRYGQVVFETSDKNLGWDGTTKGVKQNSAIFIYKCITKRNNEETVFTGTITLIR
jgi:gliding motility-associated-like protein